MKARRSPDAFRQVLEVLYARYNRRELTARDPVQFLYRYADPVDRELAGLIASSLALGNIKQILASVKTVLERLGPSPARFVTGASPERLRKTFAGFQHRFITGGDLAALLAGARRILRKCGSLRACFAAHVGPRDETVLPALSAFVTELLSAGGGTPNRLLSLPEKGSACKRLHLFLRWMVRHDHVDPGGWRAVSPAQLIMPLDTHTHRICRAISLTARKQANLRTALEVTAAFREITPDDPVRYDFALAHLGIDGGRELGVFLHQVGAGEGRSFDV